MALKGTRAMVSVKFIVVGAVGILLFGILAPIGLAAMESDSPSDPTLALIWPLTAVFFVLSVGLAYLWESMKD